MIPPIDPRTGNLPAGIHIASWDELAARYGTTHHRRALLAGLRLALENLRMAGCRRVYLDGSFITNKRVPGDFDGCWETAGVDFSLVDPVLLQFDNRRQAQKAKYRGELFLADDLADLLGHTYLDFFQQDSVTGRPKGIIAIDLGVLR